MDTEAVYKRAMKGSLRQLVKGGLVYKYWINPYAVWCEAHAPAEEKDPESPYMELIFSQGRNHEDEVSNEHYPGGLSIDPTLHEIAFRQTLDAMAAGEDFIFNGILYYLPEKLVAVPDVLVKKPRQSKLGDWYYEVVEIKSSAQIRDEHIMQAAYYTYMLQFFQGMVSDSFVMIDGKKEHTSLKYKDYSDRVLETIREIKNIYAGKAIAPAKVGWPWTSFSLKRLKEQKDISLIPYLHSTHKTALRDVGINSLQDFFSLNILSVAAIAPDTLERYRLAAKSIMQGKHIFLEKPFLPEGKTEIFLDFEGVNNLPINGKRVTCDYLIGLLVRENGSEEYRSFVSKNEEKEHEMVLAFLTFLQEQKDYVIYHYGSYEKGHLASLFHKHGIQEELASKVLDAMVDVLPLAKQYVIFPTHSYSLKELGSYLGFTWKEVGDAKDSIVLYLDFVENGNQAALEKIIQYNQDDCTALKRVKDFLVWGT